MNLVNGLYWHPKIVKAVTMLKGQAFHCEVFTLHVLALSYAHQNLTDGFLPQGTVEKLWMECAVKVSPKYLPTRNGVETGLKVAGVLSSRAVRLWHKRPGGWEIHDYLKHNPTASAVKTKREKARIRQQNWRAQHLE